MSNHWIKPVPLSWILIPLVGFALLSGCGKKAPPMAPRQPAMIAVADLEGRYQDGKVVLTRHHTPSDTAVAGYGVIDR